MVALIQSLEAAVKLAAFPAGLMLLASVIMFRVTVRRWRCASRGGRTGYQHHSQPHGENGGHTGPGLGVPAP